MIKKREIRLNSKFGFFLVAFLIFSVGVYLYNSSYYRNATGDSIYSRGDGSAENPYVFDFNKPMILTLMWVGIVILFLVILIIIYFRKFLDRFKNPSVEKQLEEQEVVEKSQGELNEVEVNSGSGIMEKTEQKKQNTFKISQEDKTEKVDEKLVGKSSNLQVESISERDTNPSLIQRLNTWNSERKKKAREKKVIMGRQRHGEKKETLDQTKTESVIAIKHTTISNQTSKGSISVKHAQITTDETIKDQIRGLIIEGKRLLAHKDSVGAVKAYNQLQRLYSQLKIKNEELFSDIIGFYEDILDKC